MRAQIEDTTWLAVMIQVQGPHCAAKVKLAPSEQLAWYAHEGMSGFSTLDELQVGGSGTR